MRRIVYALACFPLFAAVSPSDAKLQTLFLMQKNEPEQALSRYRDLVATSGRHDFDLLQQMGQLLLHQGIESSDPQTFLMTLFGAGLSGSALSLEILEKGIHHPDPQIQLIALHFAVGIDDDRTHGLLLQAMGSDFLSTRMEAAFYMAQKKHPAAAEAIEGLMALLPPFFRPYFPSFFALLGTSEATAALKRLIEDPDLSVQIEAINQVARLGRDDFLPILRKRLTHTHIAEVESAAFAVGALKDSSSIPRLKRIASFSTDSVQIAASLSLIELGDLSYLEQLATLAKNQNLFAISALGSFPGKEDLLFELSKSPDLQIRINAAVSLLHRRDVRCLSVLTQMLIQDMSDLAFHPFLSLGRTQTAWKAVPSAELRAKDPTVNLGFSLSMREHLLKEALHLPEESFLTLARQIFNRQQNDLIPVLINLLENLQTPQAISLLKEGSQKLSAPLIRDYCHLALYRIGQEGPYETYINNWVMKQKHADIIRLRPLLPWTYRMDESDYTLSPEETSRLLIDTFISIANRRDEASISFLLAAIQEGNPQNRYALMGLLMRATE